MKLVLVAVGILHLAALPLFGEPEIKGTASELAQFINGAVKAASVGGESEIRVAASRAVLTLAVITENKLLQEALRANADVRTKVIAQLKQQGISADSMAVLSSSTRTRKPSSRKPFPRPARMLASARKSMRSNLD